MEICLLEDLFGVAVDFDLITRTEDNDIIVDIEVGIVSVLVLGADANHPPIGQLCANRAHTVEAPVRPCFDILFDPKELTDVIRAVALFYHPLPVSHLHPIRVGHTEAGISLLVKQLTISIHVPLGV
jgi:hypothetical protein